MRFTNLLMMNLKRFEALCKKRFLDISKAFDKIWYQGIIFKLQLNGISGDLLNIMCYFQVRENKGLYSMVKLFNWERLSQEFLWRLCSPRLNLIEVKLFAVDTSSFSLVHASTKELNEDLNVNP